MAQQKDIIALKREWKNLFTYWHLSGCKEGGWRYTGNGYTIGLDVTSDNSTLRDYLKIVHKGYGYSGFSGVELFYSNGIVTLVACCENDTHYTFWGNIYTRNYSTGNFMNTFSLGGISPSIQKNKHCDYLLIEGSLDAFENSDFYSDCKRIYADRLMAKQEKEEFLQKAKNHILNSKERIIAILESPLLNRILEFHEINCFSFWDCNTFTIKKDCVYARKSKVTGVWDNDCYPFRFAFEKHGYRNLDYLDCSLVAVALILKRYKIDTITEEDSSLINLLTKAHFDCDKEEIQFIYHESQEKVTPDLKSLLG